jgi:hypothetical protein
MRWPKLAKYLEDDLEDLEQIGQKKQLDNNASIRNLFANEEVIKVVQGGGVATALDVKAVKQCALLRMWCRKMKASVPVFIDVDKGGFTERK